MQPLQCGIYSCDWSVVAHMHPVAPVARFQSTWEIERYITESRGFWKRRTMEAIQIRTEPHTMNHDCRPHLSLAWYPIINSNIAPDHHLPNLHACPIYFIRIVYLPPNSSTHVMTSPNTVPHSVVLQCNSCYWLLCHVNCSLIRPISR